MFPWAINYQSYNLSNHSITVTRCLKSILNLYYPAMLTEGARYGVDWNAVRCPRRSVQPNRSFVFLTLFTPQPDPRTSYVTGHSPVTSVWNGINTLRVRYERVSIAPGSG